MFHNILQICSCFKLNRKKLESDEDKKLLNPKGVTLTHLIHFCFKLAGIQKTSNQKIYFIGKLKYLAEKKSG